MLIVSIVCICGLYLLAPIMVTPMSRAALAAGADGLLVEVHPHPEQALCDGAQSITMGRFESLLQELKMISTAVNRNIGHN